MVNDVKTLLSMLDCMIDMVIVHDLEGNIIYANDALCNTTGYTKDEFSSLNVRQISPEDKDLELVTVFSGKEITCFERTGVRKDGTTFPVEVTARLAEIEGRRMVVSVARDITERKKSELALKEKEEQFGKLIKNAPIAMIVDSGVDEDEQVIMMNSKFTELFGYTKEDVPDVRHWWPLAYPDAKYRDEVKTEWIRRVEKAVHTRSEIESMETQVVCKDGSSRQIRFSMASIGDRNLITFDDHTAMKKCEDETRLLGELVDIAPASIMIVDQAGAILYANQTTLDLHGYSREEFLALTLHDIDVPESAVLIEERTRQASESGTASFEVSHYRKDRTTFPLQVCVKRTEWAGKKVFYSIATDITEREKAQEVLQKSEALVKNILESVGEGFVVIDADYRIISANKAYCEQTKQTCEEIIGRHCYEVSHRSDKPCFAAGEVCAPKQTFETGAPHLAIHTHHDKNGNPVYLETRSFPMKDAAGNFFTVIETLSNITEKRALEGQLRHAQKMEAIGTLAGGIAHDFNNLLNVIIGYASLMQESMKADAPQMSQLKEILSAGDRAAQLAKGLLAFSRKQAMEARTVNLNEIVRDFRKMLARIIGEDIDLRLTLRPGDTPALQKGEGGIGALVMKADIVQIEQILMNLVTNARDAMPRGGLLAIETAPLTMDDEFIRTHGFGEHGRYALLTVSDTGAGMDARTRERIFEPFFTTKEEGKGTGLGMSIVYGIVKQHNGFINCYSEPGKGTTFRIYLPLTKSDVEKLEEVDILVQKGGTETVLVAEDATDVRGLLKDVLELYGYRVLEAVDGEEAVKIFREKKDTIQLLIFDLIMPKMNGKDAYEDIKAIRPGIKVIFTSGYSADIIQRLGIEAGIEFISKPVSPNELLRRVREVLDNTGSAGGISP